MTTFFYNLFYLIEVVIAVAIIVLVLLQRSKSGGGIGGITGGAAMEESLGAGADELLVRITKWACIIFLVNTLALTRMAGARNASDFDSMQSEAITPPAGLNVSDEGEAKTPAATATEGSAAKADAVTTPPATEAAESTPEPAAATPAADVPPAEPASEKQPAATTE